MNGIYCALGVCWVLEYKDGNQIVFDLQVLSDGERHRQLHSWEYDEVEGRKGWNGDTDTLQLENR